MNIVVRSLSLEVTKVFASPTLIVLLLSPVTAAFVIFLLFPDSPSLVNLFLLFNIYIITVMNTSLSIVHERETGTLTAMAVTPLDLRLVLATKAAVSVGFSLLTTLAITYLAARNIPALIEPGRLAVVTGVALMTALLFAAVAVMISTFSATVKQVEQVGTGVIMGLLLVLMLPFDRLPDALQQALSWLPILNARFFLDAVLAPSFSPGPGQWAPIAVNLAIGLALVSAAITWFRAKFLR